jgi:hypothetical protein
VKTSKSSGGGEETGKREEAAHRLRPLAEEQHKREIRAGRGTCREKEL